MRKKKWVKRVWNLGDKELFAKHKINKFYKIEIGLLTKTVSKRKAKAIGHQQK